MGGARALISALAKVSTPTRLAWIERNGKTLRLLLRALPNATHVTVTALLDAPNPLERAPLLAEQLELTPRQSELAAHLLADQTVTGAARVGHLAPHRQRASDSLAAAHRHVGPQRSAGHAAANLAALNEQQGSTCRIFLQLSSEGHDDYPMHCVGEGAESQAENDAIVGGILGCTGRWGPYGGNSPIGTPQSDGLNVIYRWRIPKKLPISENHI